MRALAANLSLTREYLFRSRAKNSALTVICCAALSALKALQLR